MKLPENIQEIIRYILQFLLRTDDEKVINQIGYTSDIQDFEKYKLIIKPSRFFDKNFYGTAASLPKLPLQTFKSLSRDLVILFGNSNIEKMNNIIIFHADVIASTYFLISRYEEMIQPKMRDKHGRFIGKESIACKAGFIHYPIVEEYGKILRKYLSEVGVSLPEPTKKIETVYLTHDVDKLVHYKNIRSVSGAVLRFNKSPKNTFKALKTYFGSIENDPWFTFPWFFDLAEKIKNIRVKTIVFIKSGGGNLEQDKPLQYIENKTFKHFFELCAKEQIEIGLHPSYQAGLEPHLIADEKTLLEKVIDKKVIFNRNHYLCNREPRDFNALIEHGFTDDFTMGYADVAGFRLGTCRTVRWIDPEKQELTPLTLHPLLMMDNTLSDEKYMNLSENEAFDYAQKLIDEVRKNNGELVLLWHNTSVEKNNGLYHRRLYQLMINYLM